jgi:hypothetical protein
VSELQSKGARGRKSPLLSFYRSKVVSLKPIYQPRGAWRLPFALYRSDNTSKSLSPISLAPQTIRASKPPHHVKIISQEKDTINATFKNAINIVTHLEGR